MIKVKEIELTMLEQELYKKFPNMVDKKEIAESFRSFRKRIK